MRRKWIVWLVVLLVLVLGLVGIYLYGSTRLPVSYGEKSTWEITEDDPGYKDYLTAWAECATLMAACKENWNGDWPDYYGGMSVVENEGSYLVNVYMVGDTEENRQEVCEAAGAQIRAYTKTDVSWADLLETLSRIDAVKSLPFLSVQSMGINAEQHCVRVYISHQTVLTTMVLGLADTKGLVQMVIIPVQPSISSAVQGEDGAVTVSLSGLTYATGYIIEISPDSAFEDYVYAQSFEGNETTAILSSFGDYPYDDEDYANGSGTWYVRAKSLLEVEGSEYESEWSSAKTVTD